MPIIPSPAFTVNGGAPGVKASVAAGATVTCVLDDTSGVTYVEWSVVSTEETTATTDYTLSTTGGIVPGNQTMSFTAGIAATGGIIRAKINHGVNALTGDAVDESAAVNPTIATAKWYVPTGGAAFEVLIDGEEDESNARHGKTGVWNQAIRAMGGGGPGAFTYIELGSGTKSTVGLIRMSRNFIAMACKTSAAVDHPIITEDNADAFVLGSSTLTAGWTIDVKTGGAVIFRENAVEKARVNANGLNAGSTIYASTGITFAAAGTSAVTKTAGAGVGGTLTIKSASGAVGFAGGNIEVGPGIGGTPDVDAPGSMTHPMGSNGSTSGATIWTAGSAASFLTLYYDIAGTSVVLTTTKPTIKTDAVTSHIRQIGGVTSETLTATSLNIPTGSTFAVNGVGHATAATASALVFRGASGEASLARLYGSGTVHTTAFLSYSRNGIVLGGKTGAGVDHPFITEDGAEGLAYGDATSTTTQTFYSGGMSALILNGFGGATLGNAGGGSVSVLATGGETFGVTIGGNAAITADDTTLTSNAGFAALKTFSSSGRITVSIGTDQDDYTHADLATTSSLYIDATAAFILKGMDAGQDGEEKTIFNTSGANTITLAHETSTTASKRFKLPGGGSALVVFGGSATIKYNSSEARWRLKALT